MRRPRAALLAGLGLVALLGLATPASADAVPAASAQSAPETPSGPRHAMKMRRLFTRGLLAALFLFVGAAAAGGVVVQRKQKAKT
jgi:hypothetical protein